MGIQFMPYTGLISTVRNTASKLLRQICCISLIIVCASAVQADSHQVNDLYLQNRAELIKAYQSGGNQIAAAYTSWEPAASVPAKPGVHGKRYLMTYVNDIGHGAYVKYAPVDVDMPIGSIVAKESFKIKSGKFKPGPLFLMEKVGIEKAPKSDGWFYSGIKPNGTPMKSSQRFCHNCHKAYSGQDSLGYPAPEARLPIVMASLQSERNADDTADNIEGDATRGKSAVQACLGCHQLGGDAKNGIGPVLTAVVGRPAASYPGFKYSKSLKLAAKRGLIWHEADLFAWLAGPGAFLQHYLDDNAASSQMAIQFSDAQVRKDIIAYLVSLNAN